MKVWNASEAQIREAIDAAGLKVYGEWSAQRQPGGIVRDGRALRFRLGIDTTRERNEAGFAPFQRTQTHGYNGRAPRKLAAVCWHGHRDFMRALYRLAPDARIKTALADYRGAEDFERQYADTYGEGNDWNLGYGQACGCTPDVRERWEYSAVARWQDNYMQTEGS